MLIGISFRARAHEDHGAMNRLLERALATDSHWPSDGRQPRAPSSVRVLAIGPDTDGVACVDFMRAKTASTFLIYQPRRRRPQVSKSTNSCSPHTTTLAGKFEPDSD